MKTMNTLIQFVATHKAEIGSFVSWLASVFVAVSGAVPSPSGHVLSAIAAVLAAVAGARSRS